MRIADIFENSIPGGKKRRALSLLLSASFLAAVRIVAAQEQPKPTAALPPSPQSLQAGQLIPSIQVGDQPEQSYALYLPTNYTAERRWPIIYAFDPGARGSVPLELMKEAAERYGFVLAGSNNSRNGDSKEESQAAQAMWSGTHAIIAIDDRRVYFAGFSGGARLAATLAGGAMGGIMVGLIGWTGANLFGYK